MNEFKENPCCPLQIILFFVYNNYLSLCTSSYDSLQSSGFSNTTADLTVPKF